MFPWFTDKSASVHCTVLWEVNPRTHRGKSSTPFYWQNCRCPPHAAAAQGLSTSRASSAGAPRLRRCRDPKGTDCSSQLYSPKNVNPCFQRTLISSITKYLVKIKSLFLYLPWKNIQLNDPHRCSHWHACCNNYTYLQRWMLPWFKPMKIQGAWFCLQWQQWMLGQLPWPRDPSAKRLNPLPPPVAQSVN